MQWSKAAVGALLVSVALAGCAGGDGVGDEGAGFSVKAPDDPATEPFVFTATVEGESFQWDFGDQRPAAEGRSVEHVYGVSAGTVTVRLTVEPGNERFSRTITIGEGQNARPSFEFVAQTEWAVVGEPVRFTVEGDDPEGDPLLFSWSCIYQGLLERQGAGHGHPSGDGLPYVAPRSDFPTRVANGTDGMPGPDRVVEGDFCDNIGRGDGRFHEEATLEGAFQRAGLFRILLLAKDPVNPSVSGFYDIVVSEEGDRPDPVFEHAFAGTFTGGAGGTVQGIGNQAGSGEVFDRAEHAFRLALPSRSTTITLDVEGTGEVSLTLYRGNNEVAEGDGTLEGLQAGEYRLQVVLDHGVQVDYEVSVSGAYVMDPWEMYLLPH